MSSSGEESAAAEHEVQGLALEAPPPRVVVVAPHPGDELVGVGGLLVRLADAGSELVVVAVTDGDAAEAGSTPVELAEVRAEERSRAFRVLGLAPTVERLGLPDGGVATRAYHLSGALAEMLRADDWCLATWSGDRHPDHVASGRAAAAGCRVAGARLVEFPMTACDEGPGEVVGPADRVRRVWLDESLAARKRRAAAEHRTLARATAVAPMGTSDAETFLI